MKKSLSKGMVIGFAAALLGALAITPRPGYSQADNGRGTADTNTGGMTPDEQAQYRQGYNDSFTKAKEAEQAKLDEKSAESSGGCCG